MFLMLSNTTFQNKTCYELYKDKTILRFTACRFSEGKMSEFKKLDKRLVKAQCVKKIKANCDIMSNHFMTKIKYQKLIKLEEIQENKNNREFKIKTESDLTFKITSTETLKPSNTEKMKSFKTSCSVTVSCDLGLASSMLSGKHSSKDAPDNKTKRAKTMSDQIKEIPKITLIKEEIQKLKTSNAKLQKNVQMLKTYYCT